MVSEVDDNVIVNLFKFSSIYDDIVIDVIKIKEGDYHVRKN